MGARDAGPPLALREGPGEARLAFHAAKDLAAGLFGGALPLFSDAGTACVAHVEPMADEAYRIVFTADEITVFAAGRTGFFYAFVTLGQILHGARQRPSQFVLPLTGEIGDAPRFSWRGALLDVSRRVYQIDALHRFLDLLAWHKLNRLHLHLTDDEGWRLDIPSYPELAEIAGWQGHGLAIPPQLGSPPERHGAVYSRSRHRGVGRACDISLHRRGAGDRYARPQLRDAMRLAGARDPGETGAYHSVHHYPNNALNPAIEATYSFLETVFGTVADLFPSPLIHVGGDEVAKGAWLGSPRARSLMKTRGWSDIAQLQSHFLRRIQAVVTALGRKTGAWEEAAQGGGIDAAQSCLFAWTGPASGLALAKAGYDVIADAGHAVLSRHRPVQ